MTALLDRPHKAHKAPAAAPAERAGTRRAADYIWALLRISLGGIFLWAFLDKTFGWGFATTAEQAWVNGGSPTRGFLTFATTGPLAGFYQSLAGAVWVDVLFMVGLAGIGLALLTGVAMRIAAASGALLMVLMWSAALPPANNPVLDDHLIYAGLLIGLAAVGAGEVLGLGRYWARIPLVRRLPWLK